MTADEIHRRLQKEIADLDRRLKAVESQQVVSALHAISAQLNRMETTNMADAASILAKVTANNDAIESQTAMLVALSEGQADIKSEIAALKAANPAVDFTALDAAADKQTTLVAGAGKAIDANT